MKRHVQQTGLRKWYGDDLIELQNEPLKALEGFLKAYSSCVLSGCEVIDNTIKPGLILFVWEEQNTRHSKIVEFEGAQNITSFPQYLYLSQEIINREYQDGHVKPVAIRYYAEITNNIPAFPFVRIFNTGPEQTFRDVLQTPNYRFVTDLEKSNWNQKPYLGETENSAYRGDRGRIAYEHSQMTNIHVTSEEKSAWNNKISHELATDVNQFLVSSGIGQFVSKTISQVQSILGLGNAAYKNVGTGSNDVSSGNHTHTQSQSHNNADTDTSTTALHHTLGTGQYQAAPGNHSHRELTKSFQTLSYASTINWNINNGYNAKVTLTGNASLNILNIQNGDCGNIIVIQDSIGGRQLSLPSNSKKIDGWSFRTDPNSINILSFIFDGIYYYWTIGNKYN